VAIDGDVDSMLRFRLERGSDVTNRCRKIKWVTSAGGDVPPGKGKGGDDVWANQNLTGPKNKENSHGRFSCYKWTVKI
jgi:hypothetical protein